MSRLIHRVTMFKLHGAEKQAQLLAAYDKLSKDQSKVCAPCRLVTPSLPEEK